MEIRYWSFAIAEWTTRACVAGMAAWGKFSIRCSFAMRPQDSLDSEGMAAFLQPGHVVRPAISPESVLRANTPVDISDSYGPTNPDEVLSGVVVGVAGNVASLY